MIRRNKKLMTILMTLCIAVSGMCFSYTKALAAEVQNAVVNRIGGQDRYETSANLALSNWNKSENIVLVSGEGYADALIASVLAGKFNSPLVLIDNKDSNNTKNALENFETEILIKVPNYNETEYSLSEVNDTVIKYPEIDYGYEQVSAAINDYMVKNADYNVYNYENDIICAEDHNAYGVLVKGIGVCESYAKAMYELLNAAGIECKYVTGYAKENGIT